MKPGLFLFTCLWLSALELPAQLGLPQAREGSVRPFNEYVLSDWVLKNKQPYQDIEGSPFLNKNWAKGEIRTIHDQHFKDVLLKLNLYEGHLMHLNNFTGDSSLIREDLLWGFSLTVDDSIYIFERYDTPKVRKSLPLEDFYVVLVKGKNSLLVKPRIHLRKSTDNSLVNSSGKLKDRFVKRNEYYVLRSDTRWVRLKNSKKFLKAVFGNHLEACQGYAKQINLNWDDPNGLSELIGYFNQLDQ